MNEHRPVKRQPSLLERAADMFGIDASAHAPTIDVGTLPPEPEKKAVGTKPEPPAGEAAPAPVPAPVEVEAASTVKPSPRKEIARAAPAVVPTRQGTIDREGRSEEHTSELQSIMRISAAVICLTKKKKR